MVEIPAGIQVRQAEPSDYENVAEMHYPSWRQSYAGILTPYVLDLFDWQKWVDEEYPERLSRSGWAMWLAESDGQLMGMSIFGPESGNPDHLEIDSLYVAVENQRRGVGGLLLDKALRSQPSCDVVVWCAEKNHRARLFYEKKGFQLDGRAFLVENYDPMGALGYWRRGELRFGPWLASLRQADELAWFARDDLRPFGLMCLRMGARGVTRRFSRPRSVPAGGGQPQYLPGRAARSPSTSGSLPARPGSNTAVPLHTSNHDTGAATTLTSPFEGETR